MKTYKNVIREEELEKMSAEVEIDLSQDVKTLQSDHLVNLETSIYLGDIKSMKLTGKVNKTTLYTEYYGILIKEFIESPIKLQAPGDKRMILYFDTEHGAGQSHRIARLIQQQVPTDNLPHFKAYRLKEYTLEQRIELIEYLIKKIPNVGIIIFDGLRNLASINNEAQANMIISKIKKWSGKLKIKIHCIYHRKEVYYAKSKIEVLDEGTNPIRSIYTENKKNPHLYTLEFNNYEKGEPGINILINFLNVLSDLHE